VEFFTRRSEKEHQDRDRERERERERYHRVYVRPRSASCIILPYKASHAKTALGRRSETGNARVGSSSAFVRRNKPEGPLVRCAALPTVLFERYDVLFLRSVLRPAHANKNPRHTAGKKVLTSMSSISVYLFSKSGTGSRIIALLFIQDTYHDIL